MKIETSLSVGFVIACLFGSMEARSGILVTNGPCTQARLNTSSYSFGQKFTVGAAPVTVDSLGFFVWHGAALTNRHAVRLWQVNAGSTTLVAAAVVPPGTAGALQNDGFRYVPLGGPLTLQASSQYIIAAKTDNNVDGIYDPAGNGDGGKVFPGTGIATLNNSLYDADNKWPAVPLQTDGSSNRWAAANATQMGNGARFSAVLVNASANRRFDVYSAGVQFTVSPQGPIVVNALGYWDYQSNGLAVAHQVRLWQTTSTSSTLIASTTVPSGTAGILRNGFRYTKLQTPVTLGAGTQYVIAGLTDATEGWIDGNSTFGVYAGVGIASYDRAVYDNSSKWPACPAQDGGTLERWGPANAAYLPSAGTAVYFH